MFKPTAHRNMRQQTPFYSRRRYSLILTLLGLSDSSLKNLQWELPHIKISKPHIKNTMRKLSPSNYLCWGERALNLQRKESSYDLHQPMPKPHGHLKCHWLTIFLLLSSFIKPLFLLSLIYFILPTRSSIQRPGFFQ
jgi:hypothetical protein